MLPFGFAQQCVFFLILDHGLNYGQNHGYYLKLIALKLHLLACTCAIIHVNKI